MWLKRSRPVFIQKTVIGFAALFVLFASFRVATAAEGKKKDWSAALAFLDRIKMSGLLPTKPKKPMAWSKKGHWHGDFRFDEPINYPAVLYSPKDGKWISKPTSNFPYHRASLKISFSMRKVKGYEIKSLKKYAKKQRTSKQKYVSDLSSPAPKVKIKNYDLIIKTSFQKRRQAGAIVEEFHESKSHYKEWLARVSGKGTLSKLHKHEGPTRSKIAIYYTFERDRFGKKESWYLIATATIANKINSPKMKRLNPNVVIDAIFWAIDEASGRPHPVKQPVAKIDPNPSERATPSADPVAPEPESVAALPEPKDRASPSVKSLAAYDANPKYFGKGDRLPRRLLPTQLIGAGIKRKGTTADGVSQLIIRAEVSAKVPVVFRIEEGDGKLEPLLGGKTVTLQGRHYAMALYTPPKNFVGGSSKSRPRSLLNRSARPTRIFGKSTIEIDSLHFEAIPYKPKSNGTAKAVPAGKMKLQLHIARAPVVLVHGLGANPIECWAAAKPNGQSMVIALERMGLQPFCVNYEKSNGLNDPDSPHNDKIFTKSDGRNSSYQSNRNVVWDSPDGMPNGQDFLKSYRWLGEKVDPGWLGAEKTDQPVLPKPAFLRIGGIKQALAFYRDELDLAATQADVIGHSMGGILARVYADPSYNENYRRNENFRKGDVHRLITICTPHHGSELAMLYHEVFRHLIIDGESFVQWARSNVQQKLLTMYLDPDSGAVTDLRYHSRALRKIGSTQIPSFAIATSASNIDLINPFVDPTRKYLQLYSGIAMALFYNKPRLDAWVERRALRWSNASPQLKKTTDRLEAESLDWSDEDERRKFKHLLSSNIDMHSYYWLKRREGDYRKKLYKQIQRTIVVPAGVFENEMGLDPNEGGLFDSIKSSLSKFLIGGNVTQMHRVDKEPDVPYELIGIIRSLIFHNDSKNDGAVRTDSQIGGNPAFELIEGVVHSFAPWDDSVQTKVVELLKWDDDKFFRSNKKLIPHTFGPAGQLMPYWLPSTALANPYVYGNSAIEWSGIVKSHAEQYLHESEQRDAVIVMRPVNQDSTRLIADGAATKGMDIKGKSSNWGPHKGYIPRRQRFSKLWRVYGSQPEVRKKKIEKFNKQTEDMLANARYPERADPPKYRGRRLAVPRVLKVDLPTAIGAEQKKKYTVVLDPSPAVDAEKAVFLRDKNGVYYDWRNAIDRKNGKNVKIFHLDFPAVKLKNQPSADGALTFVKMEVMADNLEGQDPSPYLTADYDLLAIGFLKQGFEGPHPDVKRAMESGGKVPELTGYVSPPQLDLINAFNLRCKTHAKYNSGKLTHHGPETQYPGSEYVDYPLLVFDPGKPKDVDATDAVYFVIRQGPPGFRDIHLKNYFWEKKILGHNIWPNPVSKGWLWEDETSLRKYSPERGYDPRDAAGLLKYVAEQKERSNQITAIGRGRSGTSNDTEPPTEKLENLRAKAEADDDKAQFELGHALANGKMKNGTEVPKNATKAAYWYKRSALKGNKMAQYYLAKRFVSGSGVRKKEGEASYWYLKAAGQGYYKAYATIGYRFQYGKGVRKDYKKARIWNEKAINSGSVVAANNLGILYEKGYGVEKDYARALRYYKRAADKKHALGTKNLGDLYYFGRGVKQNHATALKYYRQAKALGAKSVDDDIKKAEAKLKR